MTKSRTSFIVLAPLLAAGCLATLGACTRNSEASPPAKVYIVKHMSPDGVPFATYRAEAAFAMQGCVAFRPVGEDYSEWVACGNVSVTVEGK